MKQKIQNFIYQTIIFFLRFNLFKKFSNLFVNAYFMDKGYCLDFPYLMSKSSNNLFLGENKFLSKFDILKIKNCIDIGCNVGHYSEEILKNKNTNVIAFEPLPRCEEDLKKIQTKYNKRFIYFDRALSDINGFDDIYYGDEKTPLASLEKSINKIEYVRNENKNTLKVKINKLDEFIDNYDFRNIDFIKIDSEGHELKIINGGLNFIKKNNVKLIQIEFNWHHLFTNNTIYQFANILDNYVVTQINLIDGNLMTVDENHFFSNIFQLSNFIFVEKKFFKENKNFLLKKLN